MGLLFNTPATTSAMHIINSAFRAPRFKDIKQQYADTTSTTYTDLNELAAQQAGNPTKNIGDVATTAPYYIDFAASTLSRRLAAMFKLMDMTQNSTTLPDSVSAYVAQNIIAALVGNVKAIEFFAVPWAPQPSPAPQIHASATPTLTAGGEPIVAITIYTVTADVALGVLGMPRTHGLT